MLVKLADILESSVAELLGTKIEEEHPIDPVAEQLSRINEQLAVRNRRARRVWRTVGIVLGAFVLLVVLLVTVAYLSLRTVRVYPGGDQAFPDSEREREALDPAFEEQVGLSRYGERLYQPLAGSRFLLKTDGHLWVAEMNGGTIRTIFEIMPEDAL